MATSGSVSKPNKVKTASRLGGFFRGVWGELKKVHWPTVKQVAVFTVVVLVAVAVVSLIIFGLDTVFSWILQWIL